MSTKIETIILKDLKNTDREKYNAIMALEKKINRHSSQDKNTDNLEKELHLLKTTNKRPDEKKERSPSEHREYERIRKQEQRDEINKDKKPKQKRSPSEHREYERIRKQLQRNKKETK